MTRHGWCLVLLLMLPGMMLGCRASSSREVISADLAEVAPSTETRHASAPPEATSPLSLSEPHQHAALLTATARHGSALHDLPTSPLERTPVTHLVSHQSPAAAEAETLPRAPGDAGAASSEVPAPVPLPPVLAGSSERVPEAVPAEEIAPRPLALEDVMLAVETAYPLLASAALQRQVAEGANLQAWGDFDTRLEGYSISQPEGFYENYRHAVSVERPLMNGGYLYGGYRLGEGYFAPWYKERETDDGGEFSAGIGLPLLKGRAIDDRRANVTQTRLARQEVEPAVRRQWIEFSRVASYAYWDWIAAGLAVEAQDELLRLARARAENIEQRIGAGDLEGIARINNRQLIASRETKQIETQRKLQESAIKLSLFFRDEQGNPLVPHTSLLPEEFPAERLPANWDPPTAVNRAMAASPELAELDFQARQVQVELSLAENALLPKLDALVKASKDVGEQTSSLGDKTPFELEAGLYGEVPLQRRGARGKIMSSRAKLAQLARKRQFVADKTTAAVQDALSAIAAAQGRIERAQMNLELAQESLELGRLQFDEGNINLIELNIYEQAATDARLLVIQAQADFFKSLADYRAALAISPSEVD